MRVIDTLHLAAPAQIQEVPLPLFLPLPLRPLHLLHQIERTESRIFLLYSTQKEAKGILAAARDAGLTGKSYIWIVTQPVIGPWPWSAVPC